MSPEDSSLPKVAPGPVRNDDKIRALLVIGSNHSGSTLLGFLLNSHPEITTIGEMGPNAKLDRRPEFLCSCEEPIGECEFFQEISRLMASWGVDFDPTDMRLRLHGAFSPVAWRLLFGHLGLDLVDRGRDKLREPLWTRSNRLRTLLKRNELFMRAALQISGASVFADTTKIPARIPLLQASKKLDLRAVHLVRDPRAQVYSILRWNRERSLVAQARAWNRRQEITERYLAAWPSSRRMLLRLEDLCADPNAHWRRLCQFAGVESLPLPEDFRAVAHHIVGNVMRHGSRDSRSTIRSDDRWRNEMPDEQKARVARLTRSVAARYGYALD